MASTLSANPKHKLNQAHEQDGESHATSCKEREKENEEEMEEDEVVKKFRQFKKFDIVEGLCSSDHHFKDGGSKLNQRKIEDRSLVSSAPTCNACWSRWIQKEWRILEENLPDSIFVRVYEERIDLLRAVIVGASGTPYHDGLFFFDVFFPSDYPSQPPKVYYHSHGESLNPILDKSGEICLSLLNTSLGTKDEKWVPCISTVLQVLLSIQALVLSADPFLNDPLIARWASHSMSEGMVQIYNEHVFLFYHHFEDFVVGHFRERALVILEACKSYSEGVQVGCLAEDGVQNANRDRASSRGTPTELYKIEVYLLWFMDHLLKWMRPKGTREFKRQLNSMTKSFVKAFTHIGVEDCEKFLPEPSEQADTKYASNSKLWYLAGSAAIFAAVCFSIRIASSKSK